MAIIDRSEDAGDKEKPGPRGGAKKEKKSSSRSSSIDKATTTTDASLFFSLLCSLLRNLLRCCAIDNEIFEAVLTVRQARAERELERRRNEEGDWDGRTAAGRRRRPFFRSTSLRRRRRRRRLASCAGNHHSATIRCSCSCRAETSTRKAMRGKAYLASEEKKRGKSCEKVDL